MMQSKFLKARALRKKPFELDVTSLLDILVILLIFLLKTYNPNEKIIEIVDNLNLPFSNSKKVGEKSITLQVDKKRRMWINGKNVGVFTKKMEGATIEILYRALIKERERFLQESKAKRRSLASHENIKSEDAQKDDKDGARINILLDENLPYSVLKNIMFTSGQSGFDRFKFVVKGQDG